MTWKIEEKMLYRYNKFLELLNKDIIDEQTIKNTLNCSEEEASMLYADLDRMGAIKDGKVVSEDNFKKCAMHRMVFDMRGILSYGLQEIIQNALIDDNRFVILVHENLDKRITPALSLSSKLHYLEEIFEDDKKSYIIEALASKFLYETYMESKGLFLNLYWCNKLNDIMNND